VKTVLVNGRISSRSYPRYRLARPFFHHVLKHIDRFCMQSEESARRIVDIGAEPDRVVVTGSLKFDSMEIGPAFDRGRNRVLRYFRIAKDRPVVIAASTHKGEDEAVLEVFQRIRARLPETLLIIAPRKPERFDDVEQLARRGGWNVARRSELRVDVEPRNDVVILDGIGELAQLYQIATAVFVGGSLIDQGGTTSSSRRCSARRSSSDPTCRTSRRSPGHSWRTKLPSRSAPRASWSTPCSASSTIRSGVPASERPRERSSTPTAARAPGR
jgi:3-deoxy-D-manno-octulosonic-acid transferase